MEGEEGGDAYQDADRVLSRHHPSQCTGHGDAHAYSPDKCHTVHDCPRFVCHIELKHEWSLGLGAACVIPEDSYFGPRKVNADSLGLVSYYMGGLTSKS